MKSSEVNNELRKEKKKTKELGAAFNEERHRFNAMIAANGTALDESKLSFGTRTCVTDSIISEGNVCSDGDNATERTHINAAQMGKLDSNLRKGPQGSVVKRKAWVGTDGLDSLQVDTNWQAERAALLEELQRLRSLGSAVAEMVHDFKSMQQSAVSEERVPSLEGSLRDGIPQDSPPSIRSRVSTSRGPDPATLSYCDMYALRVARKKKPPSPLIDNPVLRSGTVNTTTVASEISSSVPTPHTSKVGHRSCLSQRHALWIALPSISRVSATLYKKLRGLYNDLTDAEAACSLLEDNLFSALEELEIVRRREDDYERKELLVAEPASAALLEAMHQTAAAVCSVPGGWEQFFDSNVLEYLSSSERHFKGFTEPDYKGISPSGNDSHARSSEPLSRRSAVDVRDIRLDTSHFDTRPLSSSTSLWGSVDDVSQTSIGTIRPLSVTNLTHTVGADDGKRKETLFGIDQRTDLHHHQATEPQRQHTHTLPLHLIPIVVSRAISMMRAFSTEVIDKQQQLSTALSDLQEARARTIVALEYTDCLTTELAMSEQREASRAEAFICIESNFREDIERLNTVSHDQQHFISRLAAEVLHCKYCLSNKIVYFSYHIALTSQRVAANRIH